MDATLRFVGRVRSELSDPRDAPRQGSEGAPDAWLDLDAAVLSALHGIAVGDALVVVTWLDRADRSVLQTHPRNDRSRPVAGVFATRSPDRPNPIGLHRVTVRAIEGTRLRVGPLEAVDGTPVVDLKPVLRDSLDA
jgi:tRNA-Thr(GGU) m(6)t(6)A37 methyltransferase TsaA